MKVGDLVSFGHDLNKVGIIFMMDETVDHADPHAVWCGVQWCSGAGFMKGLGRTVTNSCYLEVISESR
jgi:hypothetical protein